MSTILPSQVWHGIQITYASEVSTTVLFYDYLLTLSSEVSLIWDAPWTTMKVLFLLSRYLPFVDIGTRIWLDVQIDPPLSVCHRIFEANSWLFYVGTALPAIILTIRTWAVWNRSRRVAIGLIIFFVVCWIPLIPVICIFVRSLAFEVYTTPSRGLSGCLITEGSSIVFVSWLSLLIYEAGMFTMMLIKGIQCYRNSGNSQTFEVVFRDGLLYYLYLFAFALANVIVVLAAPPDLKLVLIVTERLIHPILTCRAVLDIRGRVLNKSSSDLTSTIPSSF